VRARAVRGAGLALAALAAAASTPARASDAPPPGLRNARLQVRPAAPGLAAAVRATASQSGPVWLAYDVPTDGGRTLCCWESVDSMATPRSPGCRLEGRGVTMSDDVQRDAEGVVHLEDDRTAVIFLRAEGGTVNRVRALSWSCGVDAGGLPVVWIGGVRPAESAAFLATLLTDDHEGCRCLDEALLALSAHADRSALDRMIEAAHRGPTPRVRAQALFWLSQKAGRRATETITAAVSDDPESQVRQQAVFALSQLPAHEGVPKLIELARAHRDPHVRQRAMFWLGQSGDPRALAFIEQVLRN
jgi:HEAT repeat protein